MRPVKIAFLTFNGKDTNNTDKEPEVMNGSATHDSTARPDGLTKVVWKASTNMTDAEYNYTVTYTDIVLAENVEGSFCIGKKI